MNNDNTNSPLIISNGAIKRSFEYRSLTEVEIPEGVRAIESKAFRDCEDLVKVTLPESLEEIGDCAFLGCEELTEVTIPDSVKEIGEMAFCGCESLKELTLPKGFKGDLNLILRGCTSLEKVTTGPAYEQKNGCIWDRETKELVLAMPKAVVDGKLTIPEPVTGFREFALELCTATTHLVLPKSLKRINGYDLFKLRRLHRIEIEEGGEMRTDGTSIYCGNRLVLCIAPKDDGRKVVIPKGICKIDADAFSCYGDVLEEVEVLDDGDDVFEIGDRAFQWIGYDNDGRIEFKRLTFKKKRLCSVGEEAFGRCLKLKEVKNAVCIKVGIKAFECCEMLREAPIGDETTDIAEGAFSICKKIKTLTLPARMKSVSLAAFYSLTSLTQLNLNDDLEEIEDRTFSYCKRLKHADLPIGLRKMGKGAFAGCGLESVCIPESVEEIREKAFAHCEKLKEVTMPSRFVDMASDIFAECGKLKSIYTTDGQKHEFHYQKSYSSEQKKNVASIEQIVAEGRDTIKWSEFEGRQDLTEIEIPECVRTIGFSAFEGCANLARVKFNEGLEEIEDNAFEGCNELTEVVLPSSIKKIGSRAFCECPNLKALTLPNDFVAEDFTFVRGSRGLEKLKTGPAYEQKDGFIWNGDTKELMLALPQTAVGGRLAIPEPITRLNRFALQLCSDATSLLLPKSLKDITGDDLKDLDKLRKIEIADGSELRTDGAAIYCGNRLVLSIEPEGDARKFVIPNGISKIDSEAFASYGDVLEEVVVLDEGDDVFEIGDRAFNLFGPNCYGRKRLKRVLFKKKRLFSVGEESFSDCHKLEKLENGVCVGISMRAFLETALREVEFGEGITEIGFQAFSDCTKLEKIVFPRGFTAIGTNAFYGCTKLTEVHFNDELEEIGASSFPLCKNLKEVKFPLGLRVIGEDAFSCCGLESVSIPESVEEIGDGAFAFCKKLKEATLPSRFLDQKHDIFSHCNKLKKVIVCDEKLD